MKKTRFLMQFTLFLAICFCIFFVSEVVHAADPKLPVRDSSYAARYASQSIADPVEIPAGETRQVVFKFKNVGTATWNSSGSRYISAYTVNPKYHTSQFKGSNWEGSSQTASISSSVKPGEIAELAIDLKAPDKTGDYAEWFYLAAENYSWMQGGYFYIKIKVVPPSSSTSETESQTESQTEKVSSYKASRFILNTRSIEAVGGEQVRIIVGYQNIGSEIWNNYSLLAGAPTSLASADTGINLYADSSWKNVSLVLQKSEPIEPDGIMREVFYLRVPPKKGLYTAQFYLKVNDSALSDSIVTIPITVTQDAPSHYKTAFTDQEALEQTEVPRLDEEPRIRVGLRKNVSSVGFVSHQDDYKVFNGTEEAGVLPKGIAASLSYAGGVYSFAGANIFFKTNNYIRLEPKNNEHAVFSLERFERYVSWKGPRNFNQYRGAFEYRLTQDKSSVYIINDLLFEDYVAGIAETSDGSPVEYIKALLTAARTYAYYIKEYSTKHDNRNFDVVAHTGDQLYLGYSSEDLMPNVAQAARDTGGYMITYENDIVITPYFGNSDGRTRAWTEVWGGSHKPWLVSVPCEYDKRDGKRMFGHGVGMSARDTAYKAEEEGASWVDLVKYYYTGVEVERIY